MANQISSGKKRKRTIKWLMVILIIIIGFFYLRYRREHTYWIVDQKLSNGDIISILVDHNNRARYSFPHGRLVFWSIGGGDMKYDISFFYKDKKYVFSTKQKPISINIWKDNFFIIALDNSRESVINHLPTLLSKLIFYKHENGWREIKADKFPKEIAIANFYSTFDYPYPSEPENINENNFKEFKISHTVRIWLKIGKGVEFYQSDPSDFNPNGKYQADPDWVLDFKRKYIDPFWSSKNFKEYLPVVRDYDPKKDKI